MLTSHTGLTIGWLCAILSLAQVQSCTPFANPIVWVANPTGALKAVPLADLTGHVLEMCRLET